MLEDYPTSLNFIKDLSTIGELLFFGGSIRDYYVYNRYINMPRDFDIAIKIFPNNESLLEEFIGKYVHRKNRFGGYKVKIENIEFDIWNLENTWAFKENKLPAKEDNLVKSVFLSIDGIAYNFNKDTLYDEGLRRSINNKKINIVLNDNPQKDLNLLRALVFKKKYKLDFGNDLKEEYQRSLSIHEDLYERLHQLQYSHYKFEYLTRNEVIEELNSIIS
ncbi:hypothetical protein [Priestia sp. LL-8]|uniref:hypothetical protein n=1 Tax=Priestia sp. LL-8 TaxID=3110068 RepID=UPI002E25CB7F|nr:hypothetical protein [Priestia sp. LL-8]